MLTANQRAVAFDRSSRRGGLVGASVHADEDRPARSPADEPLPLRRCVTGLSVQPDYVLSDGFPVRRLPVPNLSIKKGDAVTASVAAASIVAKVTRDRMMDRYHRRFPEYGFDHTAATGRTGIETRSGDSAPLRSTGTRSRALGPASTTAIG